MTFAVRLRYERIIHGVMRQTVHSIHQPHQHHHPAHERAECWRWETMGARRTGSEGVVMADSVEPVRR